MKKLTIVFFIIQLFVVSVCAQEQNSQVQISDEKVIIDGKKFYLHSVKQGQTIYSISRAYHVDEKEIMIHNPALSQGLKAGQSIKIPMQSIDNAGSESIIDTTKFYRVEIRKKHTLYSLSKQYNVSIQEIYDANPGLDQTGLRRNDTIFIPKKLLIADEKIDFSNPERLRDTEHFIYHEVKPGETLYRLSRQYNISKDEISSLNPELLTRSMRVGEILKIPRKAQNDLIRFPEPPKEANSERQIGDSLDISWKNAGVQVSDSGLDTLKILLILPFSAEGNLENLKKQEKANNDYRLTPITENAAQFYEAFLLAVSQMDLSGKTLDLVVHDSKLNPEVVTSILSGLNNNPDLIIGPLMHDNIKLCLDYGLKNAIPVIAPVSEMDTVLLTYPNLISIEANRKIRNDFIASWLYQRSDNIVIVHDGKETSKRIAEKTKQDINDFFEVKNVTDEYEIKLFFYDMKNQSQLHDQISEQDTNFVISVSENPVHISSLMASLYQCDESYVRLLGNRSWTELANIEAEVFRFLHFSYISPMFIDYSDSLSIEFAQLYREEFLDEPQMYAYMGYDVANLILPNAFLYGKAMMNQFPLIEELNGLSMNWRFLKHHSQQPLLNTSLKMIGLSQEYQFYPVFSNDELKF
jgi:LysM repeat protein